MKSATRFVRIVTLAGAFASAHCGAMVSAGDAATTTDGSADAATTIDAATPATMTTCADIRAACTAPTATLVRGHASGLVGLDGARVAFAMRYLTVQGEGLDVPHAVASNWGTVRDGAFEVCVCMPEGANNYPDVVAAVFRPGTTGSTSRDVALATFSQRYATLGDEDLGAAFATMPQPAEIEAALAGLSSRSATIEVTGLVVDLTTTSVYAGLVADERPIAAQVAVAGAASNGGVRFSWIRPGEAYASERLAAYVDANHDNRCDAGDRGAFVSIHGTSVDLANAAWVEGEALAPVCAALAAFPN